MGRRKRQRVRPRPKPQVPTEFECPACVEPARVPTIQVLIDRKKQIAEVVCSKCGLHEVRKIKKLDEPVDVYGDFLDEYYARLESETEEEETEAEISV